MIVRKMDCSQQSQAEKGTLTLKTVSHLQSCRCTAVNTLLKGHSNNFTNAV